VLAPALVSVQALALARALAQGPQVQAQAPPLEQQQVEPPWWWNPPDAPPCRVLPTESWSPPRRATAWPQRALALAPELELVLAPVLALALPPAQPRQAPAQPRQAPAQPRQARLPQARVQRSRRRRSCSPAAAPQYRAPSPESWWQPRRVTCQGQERGQEPPPVPAQAPVLAPVLALALALELALEAPQPRAQEQVQAALLLPLARPAPLMLPDPWRCAAQHCHAPAPGSWLRPRRR